MERNSTMGGLVIAGLVAVAVIAEQGFFWGRPEPATGTIRIIDGDTVRIGEVRYRAQNYDTPEVGSRAECAAERELAARATARLRRLQWQGLHVVPIGRQDRYQRELAHFRLEDGRDVADILIAEGLAIRWQGRRGDWCVD